MFQYRFRIWRPDLKMMIPFEQIGTADDTLDSYLNNEPWCYAMLSTNIKDTNGKEIHVGDIVKKEKEYKDGRLYIIRFGEQIIDDNEGYSNNHVVGFYKESTMDERGWGQYEHMDCHFSRLTVVGNIYENPELLSNK